jgi:3-hydroxybutyryl-CoA dehydratase
MWLIEVSMLFLNSIWRWIEDMLLGKKRKLGRQIEEIDVGEKLSLTEKIEDKDLLLYLGLTGDANPLYIQHDYASLTVYQKPIVPNIMLNGIITSAISKYLPGPGSYIKHQNITYSKPVYHYQTVQFLFEVTKIDEKDRVIIVSVTGQNEDDDLVVEGTIAVKPPVSHDSTDGKALENF